MSGPAEPASRARPPRWPHTLQGRLLAVLLACLLVSCAAVAIATTVALRRFLFERLDEQLASAANRYAVSIEHPGDTDGADFDSVVGQASGTLGAHVVDGVAVAFTVVGNSADDRRTDEAHGAIASLAARIGRRSVELAGLGEYRVQVSRGPHGDLLITGLPERPIDDTLTDLLEIEAIVFAGALLGSGLVAALSVRLSLRPLTRVATTALQVSQLPLASGEVSIPDRVAVPARGTEVGRVAEAFNHMLEHVEYALSVRQSSDAQLRRFIADASHELRTPVAVIGSHAEYAQRVGAESSPEVGHALERISAETTRMSMLVDDLLLLARLDAGRPLAREAVDLTRVTLDAVHDARVAGPGHRWQLQLPDEPVQVVGDELTLHQALANLLANARAHTPDTTTVTVDLHHGTPAGSVVLTVTDDGPGVPAPLQDRIFERFVHGGSAARDSSGGTGLGLSIVSAIVLAHHGTIVMSSRPGCTEFRIDLPASTDDASAAR
jgi:two-component system OmpR family sensor kinase